MSDINIKFVSVYNIKERVTEANPSPIRMVRYSEVQPILDQLADMERKLEAALSTKAQYVGEWVMVPRVPTAKMLKVGDTVAQIASKRGVYPYIANLETVYQAMLYAAPAPPAQSVRNAALEEAAELAKHRPSHYEAQCGDYWLLNDKQLAAIINADRQKR